MTPENDNRSPLDLGELERLARAVPDALVELEKVVAATPPGWEKSSTDYNDAVGKAAKARNALNKAMSPFAVLSLIEEVKRLREALTPSGDTKAAYSGEFKMPVTQTVFDEDGELDEVTSALTIEWTAIKEIMAAISARAAPPAGGSE